MEEHPTLLAPGGSFLSRAARSWGGGGGRVEGLIIRDGPSKYRLQLNHLGGLFWVRLPQSCILSLAHTGTKKHVVTHGHGTQGAHRRWGSHTEGLTSHADTGDAPATPNTATQAACTGTRTWVPTLGHAQSHNSTPGDAGIATPQPHTAPQTCGEKCMARACSDTLRNTLIHTHTL